MWFLIKGGFWCAAMLVALSYLSPRPAVETGADRPINVTDALAAAGGAYDYVSGLCREKPEVCEKGGETLAALGIRAREGARVAFEMRDRQFGPESQTGTQAGAHIGALKSDPDPTPFPAKHAMAEDTVDADPIATAGIPVPLARPAVKAGAAAR